MIKGSGTLVLLSLVLATAWAEPIDPNNTYKFGPGAHTGLTCSDGTTDAGLGCGGSPNSIGSSRLSIYQNSASFATIEPLLLILAVPGLGVGDPLPAISDIDLYSNYNNIGGTETFDPTILFSTGTFRTLLTAGENVYDELGLDYGTSSTSFTNMAPFVPGVTSFGLVTYDINQDPGTLVVLGKGLLDVFWSAPLPAGTFAFGYGCSTGTFAVDFVVGHADCDGSAGNRDKTPFTEAGFVRDAPEFGGSLLGMANFGWVVGLGGGLLGLAVIRRRHLPAN